MEEKLTVKCTQFRNKYLAWKHTCDEHTIQSWTENTNMCVRWSEREGVCTRAKWTGQKVSAFITNQKHYA